MESRAAPQLLQQKIANSLSRSIFFYHGIPKYIWEITDSFFKSNINSFHFMKRKTANEKATQSPLPLLPYFKDILTWTCISYSHISLKVQFS